MTAQPGTRLDDLLGRIEPAISDEAIAAAALWRDRYHGVVLPALDRINARLAAKGYRIMITRRDHPPHAAVVQCLMLRGPELQPKTVTLLTSANQTISVMCSGYIRTSIPLRTLRDVTAPNLDAFLLDYAVEALTPIEPVPAPPAGAGDVSHG